MEGDLLLVTGGGKGLGRAIALAYTQKRTAQELTVLLLGREEAALKRTAQELRGAGAAKVLAHPVDLGDLRSLPSTLNELAAQLSGTSFGKATLVLNAGSLGDIQHRVQDCALTDFQPFFDFNVTSTAMLTTWFLSYCRSAGVRERFVVNISSLMAVQPYPFWGMYCAAKAARDSLLAVVAKEHAVADADGSTVKTLNYAPGPLDGDMQQIVRSQIGDDTQRAYFASAHEEGKLVKLDESASKLVRLLQENKYDSGSHVDFYDE